MKEFEHTVIPASARRGFGTVTLVALGLTCVAVNMIVGGVLGRSMATGRWFSVILLGGILLATMAAVTASYSFTTGKSFALQAEEIFGKVGARVVAGFVGAVILGWYTIQASLLGHAVAEQLAMTGAVATAIICLMPWIVATTAFLGFRGLIGLSVVAVPAIAVLAAIGVWSGQSHTAEVDNGIEPIHWSRGLTMVLSLWIVGSIATIGDVTRYARSKPVAISAATLAFLVGNTGLMLVGAWCATRFGAGDLSQVLAATGLPILGLILLIANIWSTNDNAMYSVGLNWAKASGGRYIHLVIVAVAISSLLSVFRPYQSDVLSTWLTWLGYMVAPVGGAITGCRLTQLRAPTWAAWIAVAAGIIASLPPNAPVPPLTGFAVAFVISALVGWWWPRN